MFQSPKKLNPYDVRYYDSLNKKTNQFRDEQIVPLIYWRDQNNYCIFLPNLLLLTTTTTLPIDVCVYASVKIVLYIHNLFMSHDELFIMDIFQTVQGCIIVY